MQSVLPAPAGAAQLRATVYPSCCYLEFVLKARQNENHAGHRPVLIPSLLFYNTLHV
jgi:hypothetical protein